MSEYQAGLRAQVSEYEAKHNRLAEMGMSDTTRCQHVDDVRHYLLLTLLQDQLREFDR